LYSSENTSPAILEILVYFDGLTVPQNFELLQLDLDASQMHLCTPFIVTFNFWILIK